jgi:hypothetical protein
MAQPQELKPGLESTRAMVRFFLRVIILAGFAAFSGGGFNKSMSVLLWMAMVFSAVGGFIRREQPFGTVLNHWDEMMGYAVILALLGVFEHSLPA